MGRAERILEEYRKRDFFKRLNLYLEHRDLRCQFTEIDSDERALLNAADSENKVSRIPIATGFIRTTITKCFSPRA